MTGTPTKSLCPHCLRLIDARRIVDGNAVYLQKSCPEHGDLERVLIWDSRKLPIEKWTRRRISETASPSGIADRNLSDATQKDTQAGCPFDCGICPNHKQHTCSAIVEVTTRCNLRCPVCFAASPEQFGTDPNIGQIERMLQHVRASAGSCPIQLSGGEPTLRDDLPQIVASARAIGFDHIQINTNGVRLARDPGYAKDLKAAGVTDFFLQFDGITDDVYRRIRGTDLFATKMEAIQIVSELKIAVILVPTLLKGVNDSQIGAIIEFAKSWMPTVKGVHFQPMTYLGRYPESPRNEDRMLLPDILAEIEEQMGGELTVENFIPPG